MAVAINDAGDVLISDGNGNWNPATIAKNDNGERLYLDGNEWKPIPMSGERQPSMGATAPLMQGLSMGFSDEIGAAGAATGGFLKSLTNDVMAGKMPSLSDASTAAGNSYDRRLGELRADVKDYQQAHPVLSTGATVLGGVAGATGLPTLLNAAKPTALSMIGRGAIEGAGYGGAYGFGTGEGGFENRLANAETNAAIGGVTGGVMGAVGGRMSKRAADASIPATADLKTQANAAYRAVDQAGVTLSPASYSQMVDDVASAAKTAKLNQNLHPESSEVLDILTATKGQSPTLAELDQTRQVLSEAAKSPKAGDRRIASMMLDKLDGYVNGLKVSDVVSGDPMAASQSLNQARDLWSRMRKSELIDNAVTRAERQAAATGSGGNADNAIRQKIKSILDNPNKVRGFTQGERDLMERVVRGGKIQNLTRLVGKLSPSGNGLMAALSLGATAVNPAAAVVPGIGLAAKTAADGATLRNVAQLSKVIRAGGALPQPGPLSPAQLAFLRSALITGTQQLPKAAPYIPRLAQPVSGLLE